MNAVNVFLLEQPTSRAVELQCVNRVHRVGQAAETRVYRYVCEDTIEAAIARCHAAASPDDDSGPIDRAAAASLFEHISQSPSKKKRKSSAVV